MNLKKKKKQTLFTKYESPFERIWQSGPFLHAGETINGGITTHYAKRLHNTPRLSTPLPESSLEKLLHMHTKRSS